MKRRLDNRPRIALRQAAQRWARLAEFKEPPLHGGQNYASEFERADQKLARAARRFAGSVLLQADDEVERLAASAHGRWVQHMREQGFTSRLSASGEETLVDYDQLSETEKQQPRAVVRAILEAVRG